jgi:hypothetical protein
VRIRPAETSAELSAWIAVRRVILPNERTPRVDALRRSTEAMRRLDERLGYAVRSQSIRLRTPLPLEGERRA